MLSIGGTINEGMDSTALTENLLAPVDHNKVRQVHLVHLKN